MSVGHWPARRPGSTNDELTRHYAHWREDLALAASIGATEIRYGFPWYRLNPAPGSGTGVLPMPSSPKPAGSASA